VGIFTPRYTLETRLGGSQNRTGRCWEDKSLWSRWESNPDSPRH
jgi:hypothetical protein